MENQHRKIAGYRELSAEEIDLMNRIKAKGKQLLALHDEVERHLCVQAQSAIEKAGQRGEDSAHEASRLNAAEPHRWAAIAKTDLQTGIMALVRAVAQPSDC